MFSRRRHLLTEKERVNKNLGDFRYKESEAWHLLIDLFGIEMNHNELFEISSIFEQVTHIKVGRGEKRNKGLLVKLFDDNIDEFKPFIYNIVVEDGAGNNIGPLKERANQFKKEEGKKENSEEEKEENEVCFDVINPDNEPSEDFDSFGFYNFLDGWSSCDPCSYEFQATVFEDEEKEEEDVDEKETSDSNTIFINYDNEYSFFSDELSPDEF